MNYAHDGEALVHDHLVGEGTFRLRAEAVHQERTGVHARIAILYQGTTLAWSSFNVERDEDRLRLANSAHKHLNGQAKDYPAPYLKQDLDDFCYGLWAARMGDLAPEWLTGTAEAEPPRFVLAPFLLEGGGTIVFAHPGRGKSYLTGLMAVSIDAGTEVPARNRLWQVRQQRVLFINLERGRLSVRNRLGNINAALGLPRTRPLLTMNQRGRSLQEIIGAARRAVQEHNVGLVLLDSISRAGMGDLTENNAVNRIIDGLNGLSETWLGIAHAPRGSDEHVFGGIHFDAGADVIVRLLSQQEEGGPLGVGLQIVKENDVGKQPQQILALEFTPLGLAGVRKARPGEFPDVESNRKMSLRDEVRDYLLGAGKASASELAEDLGRPRSNISTLLKRDVSFNVVERDGRHVRYGVTTPV